MYKILIIGDLHCRDTHKYHRDMSLVVSLSKISKVTYLTLAKQNLPVDSIILDDINIHYHFIIIMRPSSIPLIVDKMKDVLDSSAIWPKIVVLSKSGLWYNKSSIKNVITRYFNKTSLQWAKGLHLICIRNNTFLKQVKGILNNVKVLEPGVERPEYDDVNPYDSNKAYLVDSYEDLSEGKALTPLLFVNRPKHSLRISKRIIIYTGSLKQNNGSAFLQMANVMKQLPNYELHLFLNTFILPQNRKLCKGDDSHSLDKLRQLVFNDLPNVIIHHKYNYQKRYQYLFYASCAIDLGNEITLLECTAIGLPLVKLDVTEIVNACEQPRTDGMILLSVDTQAQCLLDYMTG